MIQRIRLNLNPIDIGDDPEGEFVRYKDHAAEVESLHREIRAAHEEGHRLTMGWRQQENRADEALAAKVVAIAEKQQAERERDEAVRLAREIFKHVPAPWGPSEDYHRMLAKRDEWREMLARMDKEGEG